MPKKTNPLRWALYGVFFGLVVSVLRYEIPEDSLKMAVILFGGAIGGAFLFGMAAVAKNLLTPHK